MYVLFDMTGYLNNSKHFISSNVTPEPREAINLIFIEAHTVNGRDGFILAKARQDL